MGEHLNQGNPILAIVPIGGSVRAFTRYRAGRPVIAVEIICHAVATNPPDYSLGKYSDWGDVARSRYFVVKGQPEASELLGRFFGRTNARISTHAFQGRKAVLAIDEGTHRLLARWRKGLPRHACARERHRAGRFRGRHRTARRRARPHRYRHEPRAQELPAPRGNRHLPGARRGVAEPVRRPLPALRVVFAQGLAVPVGGIALAWGGISSGATGHRDLFYHLRWVQ